MAELSPRLQALVSKEQIGQLLEWPGRRPLLEAIPQFSAFGRAAANTTQRAILNDKTFMGWYNQLGDILRFLATLHMVQAGCPPPPVGQLPTQQLPTPSVLLESALALVKALQEQITIFRKEKFTLI